MQSPGEVPTYLIVEPALCWRPTRMSKPQWCDLWSGGALVLVDDAAEDVQAGDGAIVDWREWEGAGDRLSEVQATVWTSLVVVLDVLVEHGFEMLS